MVDPQVDYEITFQIRQINLIDGGIYAGCQGYDEEGNLRSLKNVNTGGDSLYSFTNINLPIENRWYFIRIIVFNKDKNLAISDYEGKTNLLGATNNLKMTEKIRKIVPIITLYKRNASLSNVFLYIKDLKIHPLVFGYSIEPNGEKGNYNNSYVGADNLMPIWAKLRSLQNENGVGEISRRYLLPYDCTPLLYFL